MRFLYPTLFGMWALLVLVPIILYLFRPRPRTVMTSTLPFFKTLAREHQDAAWLKWLKYLFSLLMTLLVILFASMALGRLVVAPAADDVKTVVLLVDRSASMSAREPDRPPRLARALVDLKQRVAALPSGVGMVVIAYDRRPEVLLARTVDRRQVERMLETIETLPVEGDSDAAIALARRVAALETPAEIWHATDRDRTAEATSGADDESDAPTDTIAEPGAETTDTAADLPETATPELPEATPEPPDADSDTDADESASIEVRHLSFAGQRPLNVGITMLDVRRLPQQRGRFEVFVELFAVGKGSIETELEVLLDGQPVGIRNLTLTDGQREPLLIPVLAEHGSAQELVLRLSTKGDQLASDDVAYARIPELKPIRVMWISESPDPFTQIALSTMGSDEDIEVLQGPPSSWPPERGADVVIFDRWLPDTWPADQPAIVMQPPGSSGPVQAVKIERGGFPVDAVRSTNATHPLLFGVASGRVSLTQTSVLDTDGPLQPLWLGPQGPLLSAGQWRGQRIVVMAFDVQQSENLPLMRSYPLLVGNAIYWAAAESIAKTAGNNRRTGEVIPVVPAEVVWREFRPAESGPWSEQSVLTAGGNLLLDRLGFWEAGDEEQQRGAASLLSQAETNLSAAPGSTSGEVATVQTASFFRGDLAPPLIVGAILLLIFESWLYHRCWTN